MRSATPLRKSAARFMVDPSLAVAALGVGPEQLLRDLNATGFLSSSPLVLRDLRVYSQPLRGRLARWRDNNNHEVDIIITLDDGRWGALEVKMNPAAADGAAASLLRFKDKVDLDKVGEPAFLGVVTTRTAAVRRQDGVHILPSPHSAPNGSARHRSAVEGARPLRALGRQAPSVASSRLLSRGSWLDSTRSSACRRELDMSA